MVFVKCIPLGGVSQSEVLVFFVKPAISFFCAHQGEGREKWVNASKLHQSQRE